MNTDNHRSSHHTSHATTHAHTHKHADGTIHSHYHSHPGGDSEHNHMRAEQTQDTIVYDSSPEIHTQNNIPTHDHDDIRAIEAPLHAEKLSYAYPHKKLDVFTDLSMKAHAGSMLAILGNNGAGKSTLLDLLTGTTKPREGCIMVGEKTIHSLSRREAAQRIAYVAQQQTIPHLSVYDEVLLGRKPHITWSVSEKDRRVVAHAIASLQLEEFSHRYCDELSGGERQKVFIARALAQEPQILILDEPTSALDPKNQLEVLAALRAITHHERLATIAVLHDINLALRFCDRFILMHDGHIVSQGGSEALTDETLSETYDTHFKLLEVDGVRIALPSLS